MRIFTIPVLVVILIGCGGGGESTAVLECSQELSTLSLASRPIGPLSRLFPADFEGELSDAHAVADDLSFELLDKPAPRSRVFRETLRRGQSLDIAGSSNRAAELLVFDEDRQLVWAGGPDEQRRCVRISRDGVYYVQAAVPWTPGAGHPFAEPRIAVSSTSGTGTTCPNATAPDGGNVPGELIALRAAGEQAMEDAAQGLPKVSLPAAATERVQRLARSDPALARLVSKRHAHLAAHGVPARTLWQLDTLSYAALLRSSGQYRRVMPDRMHQPATTVVGLPPPTDPEYVSQQWHLEQIEWPAAMTRLAGLAPQPTRRPVIAVIDSGVALDHLDLVNQLEIETGYDFIRDVASGDDPGIRQNGTPDRSWTFHGTRVAGMAAAEAFNGRYGASVAPMARILPLRVGGSGGYTESAILQAILYSAGLRYSDSSIIADVAARRADIATLSLGSRAECSPAYREVVEAARGRGVLLVAASGNGASLDDLDVVQSPARCPGVIAVGATGGDGRRADYSSGGPELRLLAPGGDDFVAVFATAARFDGPTRVNTFGGATGTSFSVPHVAGVLAMMRWVNPLITPDQVDELIAQGQLVDAKGPACRDDRYGYGRVNALRAVDAAVALTTP